MKAYCRVILAAITLPEFCMCFLATSPTFQVEVPPNLTENSISSVLCNISAETTRKSNHDVWFEIDKKELDFQILVSSPFGISAISVNNTWTRYDNGKQIACCLQYSEGSYDVVNHHIKCSEKQTLNILFPPSYIRLEEVQMENRTVGASDLILKCMTNASNPVTKLVWTGLTSTMTIKHQSIHTYYNETDSFAVTEIMFMNLSSQDIGLTIECQANYTGLPDINLSASYTINVTLSPEVTITGDPVQTVRRGRSVTFRCFVDSNPLSHIAWYNDTGVLIDSRHHVYLDLELEDVTLDHNGSVFTCTGHNDVGFGKNQSVTLIVQDIQAVTEDDHFLSFLGIDLDIGIVIIAANVVVIISVVVIFVICRKKQRTKRVANGDQDVDVDQDAEDMEEANTVTMDEDVVVYARVNKPPKAPVAGPGTGVVPVTGPVCGKVAVAGPGSGNVPVPAPRGCNAPLTVPRGDNALVAVQRSCNDPVAAPRRVDAPVLEAWPECDNVPDVVPGGGNVPVVGPESGNIPETPPVCDNVPTIAADNEDDQQHQASFEETNERYYENVDNEELGSLAERNIVPPPYDAGCHDDDEGHYDEQEAPKTKTPNTLIYADVEFPGCSGETNLIFGDDPTVYSSVIFDNTETHSYIKTHDE